MSDKKEICKTCSGSGNVVCRGCGGIDSSPKKDDERFKALLL